MGISEVTDALTIVVSEETGAVSCTKNGELHRDLNQDNLRDMLQAHLSLNQKTSEKKSWKRRGNKNG